MSDAQTRIRRTVVNRARKRVARYNLRDLIMTEVFAHWGSRVASGQPFVDPALLRVSLQHDLLRRDPALADIRIRRCHSSTVRMDNIIVGGIGAGEINRIFDILIADHAAPLIPDVILPLNILVRIFCRIDCRIGCGGIV